MLFVPSNHEDISKYYKNTYVKFKNFGDTLYFINHVSSTKVSGTDQDGNPFDLDLNEEAPFEMEYVLPHRAVFQYGDIAVVLQRRPERQYRRGLCGNNVMVSKVGSGRLDLTFDVLKAYVSKQSYHCLNDVFTSTKQSLAISPRFSVIVSTGDILLDNTVVGRVLRASKTIRVRHPAFRKEMEEFAKEAKMEMAK